MSSTQTTLIGGGGIKSVQRGVTATSKTAVTNVTLTAVNLSKCFLSINQSGGQTSDGTIIIGSFSRANLTSTTNLQFSVCDIVNVTYTTPPTVAWEVIEFY